MPTKDALPISDPLGYECECGSRTNGKVLLFYNYTRLSPASVKRLEGEILKFNEIHLQQLRGKVRIAQEGFNITVAGSNEIMALFIAMMLELDSQALIAADSADSTSEKGLDRLLDGIELFYSDPTNYDDRAFIDGEILQAISATKLADLKPQSLSHYLYSFFKPSNGCMHVFASLSVKQVPLLFDGIPSNKMQIPVSSKSLAYSILNPQLQQSTSLPPPQFHTAIQNPPPDSIILDCRNYYESQVGSFLGSITPQIRKYSLLKAYLASNPHIVRGKTVYAYCTGGVRCETASHLIREAGARDVFTLEGGIKAYLDSTPDPLFKGANYVFDARGVEGENGVGGKCGGCGVESNRLGKCKCQAVVVECEECRGQVYCCKGCREGRKRPCDCEIERAKLLK